VKAVARNTRSWIFWAAIVLAAVPACSSGSAKSDTSGQAPSAPATTSAGPPKSVAPRASSAAATTNANLAPNPNGVESRCFVGTGDGVNIEFYGIDASTICYKYVPLLAEAGFPNRPVHPFSQGNEIPRGYSVACGLRWPLSFGNLEAYVNGYSSGQVDGDPGPDAKKFCAKMVTLGWKLA
jgi:hypothetical protein